MSGATAVSGSGAGKGGGGVNAFESTDGGMDGECVWMARLAHPPPAVSPMLSRQTLASRTDKAVPAPNTFAMGRKDRRASTDMP